MSEDISNYQTNVLKPQNFSVSFKRIPNVVFHCRQVPLPTISVQQINIPTGEGFPWNVPGTSTNYEPFVLMFAVDEDLKNYNELFDWLEEIRKEDFDEEKHTQDASVILNTNKNRGNVEFIYENCWPMNMTEITFNVNDETPEAMCTVIFSYTKLTRNKSTSL